MEEYPNNPLCPIVIGQSCATSVGNSVSLHPIAQGLQSAMAQGSAIYNSCVAGVIQRLRDDAHDDEDKLAEIAKIEDHLSEQRKKYEKTIASTIYGRTTSREGKQISKLNAQNEVMRETIRQLEENLATMGDNNNTLSQASTATRDLAKDLVSKYRNEPGKLQRFQVVG